MSKIKQRIAEIEIEIKEVVIDAKTQSSEMLTRKVMERAKQLEDLRDYYKSLL